MDFWYVLGKTLLKTSDRFRFYGKSRENRNPTQKVSVALEGIRRDAHLPPKYAAEITAVRKTNCHGNFFYIFVTLGQQHLGLVDPITVEICDRRHADFLAKTQGQIIAIQPQMMSQVITRDLLGIVLVQVSHGLADQPLCFTAQLAFARQGR